MPRKPAVSVQQKRAGRRAADTRALYSYETDQFRDPGLIRRRSMPALRRMAQKLWEAENTGRNEAMPEIVAGDGYYQNGRWLSYCEGRRKIVLARHERNHLVLIHELTHALGYATHGVRFRARYFKLLTRYGGRLSAETKAALAVDVRTLQPGA